MPVRLLQLLGALVVIAALGVAPSMATTNTAPRAKAADGDCDNNGPWSNWGHDWYGHDGNGRYWRGWDDGDGYFNGHAYYGNCGRYGSAARSAAAGRVARVMVAVKRLRSSGCQHLTRGGHLSRVGRCGGTHWMKANGTRNWRFDIPKALPPGRYRLHRRAVDATGKREKTDLLHLRIR
jgi:hypothetical protein